MTNRVIKMWSVLANRLEPEVTLELEAVEYSKIHNEEVCILRLVGKNSFPKMTPSDILANPSIMAGLSKEDIVTITKLEMKIKNNKNKKRIIEADRNGTVVLQDSDGRTERYSEQLIFNDPNLLNSLSGTDGNRIGYSVGYKAGLKTTEEKNILKNVRDKILKLIPNLFTWK